MMAWLNSGHEAGNLSDAEGSGADESPAAPPAPRPGGLARFGHLGPHECPRIDMAALQSLNTTLTLWTSLVDGESLSAMRFLSAVAGMQFSAQKVSGPWRPMADKSES